MTVRNFDDWIQAYLNLVRGRTEAPEVFAYWSAVATIGAAVTRRVYIDEVIYKIYPNWMIVLAALPGRAKKSSTTDMCLGLLRERHAQELFGSDETNWPDMCRTFAQRTQYMSNPNSGAQTDLDEQIETQCAITYVLREFGTFLNPDDSHAIDGITQLWDCADRPFIKSTKFSGVDEIKNPFFNLIGCTTTKWLKDNFQRYQGWGIASRIIFVHSEAANEPIWSPSRLFQPEEYRQTRIKLQDDLDHFMTLFGACTFSADAAEYAERWYRQTFEYLKDYAAQPDADSWLCDFLARKQIHAHKLAMVLSISRRDSLEITFADYVEAVARIEDVEREISIVFRTSLSPSDGAMNERAIFERIRTELNNGLGGKAPKSYLCNRIAMYVDGNMAERILTSFVRRGLLFEEQSKAGIMICLSESAK